MSFKPYPVFPFVTGMERDKAPFLLENDAFPELNDCFLYQGKIIRRYGNDSVSDDFGWFALTYVNPIGAGAITYTNTLVAIPVTPNSVTIIIQDMTAAGDVVLYTFVDDGAGNLNAGAGTGGTINYATGVFVITFPALPVPAGSYNIRVRYQSVTRPIGRLVQDLNAGALPNTGATPYVTNIFVTFPLLALGIQPGSVTINVAAPVGPLVFTDPTVTGFLIDATLTWTGTIDYSSGDISFSHPAGAASAVTITCAYFTGRPVMGLCRRETVTLNREDLIAFDTVKANLYNLGTLRFDDISYDTAGVAIAWTSTDSEFFWSTNYYVDNTNRNLFWVTNNKQNTIVGPEVRDGIQIYNGVGFALQTPQLAAAANRFLNGCLILIPYRNRMVALNTLESTAAVGVLATRFSNRARWSQNGVPYTNTLGGAVATAWVDDTPGLGGYIDAPTSEQIVSCAFYKDTLVVFFEESTWQLYYTGNEVLPFLWQKINLQHGCESTHSTVVFDKGIFAVGDKAIIISDSINVERIDLKIPREVFEFHNRGDGPQRVYGIKDYFFQFVYWIFPNAKQDPNDPQHTFFPNRVLVLNYLEGSYSFYKDRYTCFGYFQSVSDRTWANSIFSWETAIGTWASAWNQADFPSVVAGNSQGFVVYINQPKNSNDPLLYITGITNAAQAVVACPVHGLEVNEYVIFSGVEGMTQINGLVGKIVATANVNQLTVDIDTTAFGAYTRGGYLEYLNNIEVTTKRFNPFFANGKSVRANYIDVYVERTTNGAFTVEIYIDDTNTAPIFSTSVTTVANYGPAISTGKMWQRVFVDVKGQFLQLKFTLNEAQIRDPVTLLPLDAINSNIVIHAINMWMQESGRLFSYDI